MEMVLLPDSNFSNEEINWVIENIPNDSEPSTVSKFNHEANGVYEACNLTDDILTKINKEYNKFQKDGSTISESIEQILLRGSYELKLALIVKGCQAYKGDSIGEMIKAKLKGEIGGFGAIMGGGIIGGDMSSDDLMKKLIKLRDFLKSQSDDDDSK